MSRRSNMMEFLVEFDVNVPAGSLRI